MLATLFIVKFSMNVLLGAAVVSGDMTIDPPVWPFATIVALEYTARSMSIIPKTISFFKLLPSPLRV